MKVAEYRDEMMNLLVRVDTRHQEIFHRLDAIDKHLEKLNGKVANHEASLIKIKTIGMLAMFVIPIVINIVMRIL